MIGSFGLDGRLATPSNPPGSGSATGTGRADSSVRARFSRRPLSGDYDLRTQNGAWSTVVPEIAVFDDDFVTANIHAGLEVGPNQRQSLHDLIIGSQGVQLNEELQRHVRRIEQHNSDLSALGAAIPAEARGGLSFDQFCALQARPNVEVEIAAAERRLAAARDADVVTRRPSFSAIDLPILDLPAIRELLRQDLPDLQAQAAAEVQEHIARLGRGGERWIADGIDLVGRSSAGRDERHCPFCDQVLEPSHLYHHYDARFGEAYRRLKERVTAALADLRQRHGGDAVGAFERSIRVASEGSQFWRRYCETPNVEVDTAEIAGHWRRVFEALAEALSQKSLAPLEVIEIDNNVVSASVAYEAARRELDRLGAELTVANQRIAVVKEQIAAGQNVAILERDLDVLQKARARHEAPVAARCEAYLAEKAAKGITEGLRDQAREALARYREQVFPAYENALNTYLVRFGAGFRLSRVASQNNRGGSSATYHVLIDQVDVPLVGGGGAPSFKNTLSAGDRNTLALAFFFASLERKPDFANQIVVIDDPMTSLDENRTLTTRQELQRLIGQVQQIILLSHSKPFLCEVWDNTDTTLRSAMKIVRDNAGSTLAAWDVNRDCITEHDKRHELVRQYLVSALGVNEREVAGTHPMKAAGFRLPRVVTSGHGYR